MGEGENRNRRQLYDNTPRVHRASGNTMTFVADRSAETGHADSFWAIAHTIDNEPLAHDNQRTSRWGNLGKAA